MLLEDKNAVIYGAGGAIGGAVGRAFAREGARVFLAGRTLTRLEKVAEEIRSTGGIAETARVDALDEKAVDEHADAVAASAGGIDISFNLISHGDVHGTPMADMDLEDYARPVVTAVRTGWAREGVGDFTLVPRRLLARPNSAEDGLFRTVETGHPRCREALSGESVQEAQPGPQGHLPSCRPSVLLQRLFYTPLAA